MLLCTNVCSRCIYWLNALPALPLTSLLFLCFAYINDRGHSHVSHILSSRHPCPRFPRWSSRPAGKFPDQDPQLGFRILAAPACRESRNGRVLMATLGHVENYNASRKFSHQNTFFVYAWPRSVYFSYLSSIDLYRRENSVPTLNS